MAVRYARLADEKNKARWNKKRQKEKADAVDACWLNEEREREKRRESRLRWTKYDDDEGRGRRDEEMVEEEEEDRELHRMQEWKDEGGNCGG